MWKSQYKNAKGRFCKRKNDDKKNKALQAMSEAKKKKVSDSVKKDFYERRLFEGNRVINLKEFAKNLKCQKCQNLLDLENSVDEKRFGLFSTFIIVCDNCHTQNNVETCKKHSHEGKDYSDMNTTAVLGTIHSGQGFTSLTKLFSCMDVPTMTEKMYKKYEKEVGHAIEEAAQDSCRRAAREEKCLVIANAEKLSELL